MKKITTILLLFTFFNVFAQWSTDPSVNNPISTTDENQVGPKMISDGNGGAIITWVDSRSQGSQGVNIYAQRIDATGITQWTTNGVTVCNAVNDQHSPQIISDGNGGAIIVWRDERISGSLFPQIYAQRINSSGVRQWANNGVVITPTNRVESQGMSIASDGSGGAIIIFEEHQASEVTNQTGNNIFTQHINSLGVIEWAVSQTGVSGIPVCAAPENQSIASTYSDGSGGAFITWRDYRSGTNYDIYAQRINALGESQWAIDGISICTKPNNQKPSSIISDGSNGAIIIWEDLRNGTNNSDIYSQRINSSGVTQWTNDGKAVTTAADNQVDASALSDNSNGAIIVWTEYRPCCYSNIYTQRINSLGIKQWTNNGILINTVSTTPYSPKIVSDGGDGVILTWVEYRNGIDYDIYAQHFDRNGLIQWTDGGVAIGTATNTQNDNQIIPDGSGNAIIAWSDYRSGFNYDVYAQRVNTDGLLSIQSQEINENKLNIYPNPTKGLVTIEAEESITSITIFNELGKIIYKESNSNFFKKEIDFRELSQGLYFYKITLGENKIINGKLIIAE